MLYSLRHFLFTPCGGSKKSLLSLCRGLRQKPPNRAAKARCAHVWPYTLRKPLKRLCGLF